MVSIILTVIRHGQTTGNKQKIMQGHLDFPLTELGRTQAKCVATRLQAEKYAQIFSSDLNRAFETAQIIAKTNKYFDAEIKTDTRLRERNYGELEGKFLSEVKEITRGQSLMAFTPKGAETVEQVRNRAELFFKDLIKNLLEMNPISPLSRDCHVLLVSHGGFIKELITYLVEKRNCNLPGDKKEASRISPNTGLSKFLISGNSFDDAKITCTVIHDQAHLTEHGYSGENFPHNNEEAL